MRRPRTALLLLAVLGLTVPGTSTVPTGGADCASFTTCDTCTAQSCAYCELDGACHSTTDGSNPCSVFESFEADDHGLCDCKAGCTPGVGVNASVCSWYTEVTGSSDPMQWSGGDFLPVNYRVAAHCACSGCGDLIPDCSKYWALEGPAEQCVRQQLYEGHLALNATFRQFIKDTPYIDNYKYVGYFYDLHVRAYASCCCPGAPAPADTWYGVFYAGALLPCPAVLDSILALGRCGCGW